MRIRNRTIIPNWQEAERLPAASVIRDADGCVYEAIGEPLVDGLMWLTPGTDSAFRADDLGYPAELIWHPAWKKETP